jgi:Family of unknown function (DUF6491)
MRKAKPISLIVGAMFAVATSVASAADNPPPPAASSVAAAPAPAPEVQIPFARTNLWNWQVIDDQTVLIQDQSRRWYKATLFGRCINLPFAGDRIGFDSNPGGTFDKFSAILVRGQRCPLQSLVASAGPPKKQKAKKTDPAPAAQ